MFSVTKPPLLEKIIEAGSTLGWHDGRDGALRRLRISIRRLKGLSRAPHCGVPTNLRADPRTSLTTTNRFVFPAAARWRRLAPARHPRLWFHERGGLRNRSLRPE